MALVRRNVAVGRAPVLTATPGIPRQDGFPGAIGVATLAPPGGQAPVEGQGYGPGYAPGVVPGHENAAAVPSPPAKPWAMLTGLGLTAVGAIGAYNIGAFMQPTPFQVGNQMSTFGALFVFAASVERVLEPFSRFMPGPKEQERYERAVADMDNGVAGAMHAAAHYKAAMDSARRSRAILMWGLATLVATLLSAAGGFYILRLISADAGWHGVSPWVDALLTGLVVGSGTKPLHDVVTRVQRQGNPDQIPV